MTAHLQPPPWRAPLPRGRKPTRRSALLAGRTRSRAPTYRRASGWAGFSLIEILIAIAIAGMAFMVLTQAFANIMLSLTNMEIKADHEPDIRFVRSQIILESDREKFEDGDEIESLNLGRARWRAEVWETNIIDLFEARIEIEFAPPRGPRFTVVETLYLLRPTWSDPVDRSILLDEARRRTDDNRRFGLW
jgi:prepilin-type N-terminal cleavage/methylation domain-containing protein